MAKQLIRTYAFTPGAANIGTLEIQGRYDLGQVLIITNVTRNVILYNFADSTFAGTKLELTRNNSVNFPSATQTSDGTTLITLAVSTVGQLSTDNIQIFVERNEVITRPWAMGTDAFERMRVANPVSMLDADFEYGLQPTKWQMIQMVRGTPSVYEIPGTDLTLVSMTTNASGGGVRGTVESLITVVTAQPHGITTGTAVTVNGLNSEISGYDRAEGAMIVDSVTGTNVFTYYAKGQVSTATNTRIETTYTVVRKAGFYTGANTTATFSVSGAGATTTGTVTLTFAFNHGYVPSAGIFVVVTSDTGANGHSLCQGPFYVLSVPTPTTLTYLARNTGTVVGIVSGSVYSRPDGFFQHRPYDGGVQLGAGGPNHGSHALRMSKKYLRYQSGKAINYNTAALFAPNFDIRGITATNTTVGSTIFVTTDDVDHGMQSGATIQLSGVTSTGFNGTYTVATIVTERVFTVTATNVLSTTTAVLATPATLVLANWHGATVRAGTFDDQNGMFWQYDGQLMTLGLRSSTFQTAGTINVVPGQTLITGNFTRFNEQLKESDRVVIKGMSHVVTAITSATWMYVNPPYRGTTSSNSVKMVKTNEILVPQPTWNLDRCDGSNGPFNSSGYNLIPNKLQMIGLQWTWYGAGFIDWMLRGPDGNYLTVHRMKQSNINNEAYMRSGNMPVRYEVQNEGAKSSLSVFMATTASSIPVADLTFFPTSGTVLIDNELISYNGKSAATGVGTLNNLTRSATLTYYIAGDTRTFTAGANANHNAGAGVILISMTATPTISHWGSAFLTDGGFDSDRGYIFNYQANNVTISTRKATAFAIRLAPSVSNAIVGDLGARELINRAQLLLQGIEITAGSSSSSAFSGSVNTSTGIIVEAVLNPSNYPSNPDRITWFTLQGSPSGGFALGSGQPSFSQIATAESINFDNTATYTTTVSGNPNAGLSTISVASTASIIVGDVVTNSNTPLSIGGNVSVISIGSGNITLSRPLIRNANNNDTLVFFRNYWAQPGETVFSFVSSPASRDSLDLSQLKELTNTPIGGRGCFPNGPDVLFINVYLTQGIPIQANLVLRWGEAQA